MGDRELQQSGDLRRERRQNGPRPPHNFELSGHHVGFPVDLLVHRPENVFPHCDYPNWVCGNTILGELVCNRCRGSQWLHFVCERRISVPSSNAAQLKHRNAWGIPQ